MKTETIKSRSLEASNRVWKNLIRDIIFNPVTAHRCSCDGTMPAWAQNFATTIASDSSCENLRQAIEECLEEPSISKSWLVEAEAQKMPTWLRHIFDILSRVPDTSLKSGEALENTKRLYC